MMHKYSEILLSHKKEWNSVIGSDADEPRVLNRMKYVRKRKTNTVE